ncbi:MAG: hypothetical protein HUU38_12930 [Anaerolineales bacterium]|nr:hypothetical protein [Anaerolineales bacterium]
MSYNVISAFVVLLLAKGWVLVFIRRKFTLLWLRKITSWLALLFSPMIGTLWMVVDFPEPRSFSFIPTTFLSILFDVAILQWVRVIYEPPHTTTDLDYPDNPDLTNF